MNYTLGQKLLDCVLVLFILDIPLYIAHFVFNKDVGLIPYIVLGVCVGGTISIWQPYLPWREGLKDE